MTRPTVKVKGQRFVMVPVGELRRLEKLAARAQQAAELPAWPRPDAAGNRPAVAFARVSIARSIIEQRTAAGLTQVELAEKAGLRQETISRIESGKNSPTVRTVEKIERAIQQTLAEKSPAKSSRPRTTRK